MLGRTILTSAIVIPWLTASASANALRHFSFEKRVKVADIVVIARTIESNELKNGDWPFRESKLLVANYLKGQGEQTIVVRDYDLNVAEASSRCCTVGKTYFLILQRGREGIFTAVNGPYGSYEIDRNDTADPKPQHCRKANAGDG